MAGTVDNTRSSSGGDDVPSGSVSVSQPHEGHVRISVAGYDSVGFYSNTYQYLTRDQLVEHMRHVMGSLRQIAPDKYADLVFTAATQALK